MKAWQWQIYFIATRNDVIGQIDFFVCDNWIYNIIIFLGVAHLSGVKVTGDFAQPHKACLCLM